MSQVKYTGHAGSGGLQGHSIGALYPYIVYGQGHPTSYGVMNGATGYDSGAIMDCEGAYRLAELKKQQDNRVATVKRIMGFYHGTARSPQVRA